MCVDLVNEYFGENFITFICDKSPQCWDRIELDSNFDFGYVDGGHDEEPCYADLVNFANLNIPFFLVDDIDMEKVQRCIDRFFDVRDGYKRGMVSERASIFEFIRI